MLPRQPVRRFCHQPRRQQMKGAIATHRPRATVSHRGQPLAAVITARPQADHLYGGRAPERPRCGRPQAAPCYPHRPPGSPHSISRFVLTGRDRARVYPPIWRHPGGWCLMLTPHRPGCSVAATSLRERSRSMTQCLWLVVRCGLARPAAGHQAVRVAGDARPRRRASSPPARFRAQHTDMHAVRELLALGNANGTCRTASHQGGTEVPWLACAA